MNSQTEYNEMIAKAILIPDRNYGLVRHPQTEFRSVSHLVKPLLNISADLSYDDAARNSL